MALNGVRLEVVLMIILEELSAEMSISVVAVRRCGGAWSPSRRRLALPRPSVSRSPDRVVTALLRRATLARLNADRRGHPDGER